jgi:hypothetical protein
MGSQANQIEHLLSSALRTPRTSVGIWHDFGIDDYTDLAFHQILANTLSNALKSKDLDLTAVHIGVGAATVIFTIFPPTLDYDAFP